MAWHVTWWLAVIDNESLGIRPQVIPELPQTFSYLPQYLRAVDLLLLMSVTIIHYKCNSANEKQGRQVMLLSVFQKIVNERQSRSQILSLLIFHSPNIVGGGTWKTERYQTRRVLKPIWGWTPHRSSFLSQSTVANACLIDASRSSDCHAMDWNAPGVKVSKMTHGRVGVGRRDYF